MTDNLEDVSALEADQDPATVPEPPFEGAFREWLDGFAGEEQHRVSRNYLADLEEAFKDGYSAGMAWQQVHGRPASAAGRDPKENPDA